MHGVARRADRTGVLHAAFGKCSFPTEHLYANLGALTAAVLASRPKGLKGGGGGPSMSKGCRFGHCLSHARLTAHAASNGKCHVCRPALLVVRRTCTECCI